MHDAHANVCLLSIVERLECVTHECWIFKSDVWVVETEKANPQRIGVTTTGGDQEIRGCVIEVGETEIIAKHRSERDIVDVLLTGAEPAGFLQILQRIFKDGAVVIV